MALGDHRKSLVVDGEMGFIAGLCVGSAWIGDCAKNLEPWRDTGVEIFIRTLLFPYEKFSI